MPPAGIPSTQTVSPSTLQALAGLPGAILGMLAALVVAFGLAHVLGGLLEIGLLALLGRGQAPESLRRDVMGPVRVFRRVAFLLLAVVLAFPALEIAGYRLPGGVRRDVLVEWVLGSGVRIAAIALVSWILIRLVGAVIARVEREVRAETGHDATERAKRIRTLGNLVASALGVVIAGAALLIILQELRINILPLLTGAGIAGLAIGFGAQSLVKDVISGFFIILENQVRVGDVAVINGQSGLVEALTPRTIVLRDVDGTVYVFPNGSITTLANQTKDFSFAVLDINVGLREDADRVMEVLRDTADQLRADPGWAGPILAPLEVFGIERWTESAMTIRVRLKTVPLKQWEVARELRRRVKKAFDAEGIEIPVPQRMVHIGAAELRRFSGAREDAAGDQRGPT